MSKQIGDVTAFDAAVYLDTPEARAEYLTAFLEDGTDDEIRSALLLIARAAAEDEGGDDTSVDVSAPSDFMAVIRAMRSWGIGLTAMPLTSAD